jgi:hypothetical protein
MHRSTQRPIASRQMRRLPARVAANVAMRVAATVSSWNEYIVYGEVNPIGLETELNARY